MCVNTIYLHNEFNCSEAKNILLVISTITKTELISVSKKHFASTSDFNLLTENFIIVHFVPLPF